MSSIFLKGIYFSHEPKCNAENEKDQNYVFLIVDLLFHV